MSELELRGVSKRLGDHLAVDELSFRVAEGELFVLLGPSGGGKTTTLRLICGLERPDRGEIILDGADISGRPPRERNLGMVFQEYGLYPAMDTWGNIAYGLQARGRHDKAEIERRVAAAAAALGLTDKLRRSTQDLSGGEQQRVALARAMVKDASAYLFDEPLSNLDPKLRSRARRDILAVHRRNRQPSVYVTHDQSEAFAIADRIGVMAGGRLQQVGTPDELLAAPANVFMARFLGSPPMNLLPAALHLDDGSVRVMAAGLSLALPEAAGQALTGYRKQRVLVGVRPEALHRAGASPVAGNGSSTGTGGGVIEGTVVAAEPGLTELIVRVATGDGATLTAVLTGDLDLAPSQPIRLGVDPAKVRLFDPDTEQALTDVRP